MKRFLLPIALILTSYIASFGQQGPSKETVKQAEARCDNIRKQIKEEDDRHDKNDKTREANCKRDIDGLEAQIKVDEKNLKTEQGNLEKLKKEKESKLKACETEVKKDENVDDCKKAVEDFYKGRIENAQKRVDAAQKELDKHNKNLTDMKERCDKSEEQEEKRHNDRIDSLNNELDKCEDHVKDLKQQIKNNNKLESTAESIDMIIYPNPARDHLVIKYFANWTTPIQFHIYSPLGQLVQTLTKESSDGSGTVEFDISRLPPGIYVLEATNRELTNRVMFVIE